MCVFVGACACVCLSVVGLPLENSFCFARAQLDNLMIHNTLWKIMHFKHEDLPSPANSIDKVAFKGEKQKKREES